MPKSRQARSRSWQLNRLVDEFERRGWRDDGQSALALVLYVDSADRLPRLSEIRRIVDPSFVARNGTTVGDVASALRMAYVDRR